MKTHSKKILVVEDEVIIAYSLQHILTKMGYEVAEIVHSGEEAIVRAQEINPDLILMDIQLRDDMDGIEAAERIRQLGSAPPIIYLTAYADEQTVVRAKITEPFGYILKPFEERELNICIEMAFYKHHLEKRLKESEQRFQTTLKSIGQAVITTDMAGRINFMNFLAENLLQTSQEKALKKHFEDLWHFETEQPNPVRTALHQGISVKLPQGSMIAGQEGKHDISNTLISPIISDDGETLGTVIVFHDAD